MQRRALRYVPLALLSLSSCADPGDSSTGLLEKYSSEGTRILRSEVGRLTGPTSAAPETVARDFLANNTNLSDIDQLVVDSVSISPVGVTHVRFSQRVEGLRVHGAYARVALSKHGEVIHVLDHLAVVPGRVIPARVSPEEALEAVLWTLAYQTRPALRAQRADHTDFETTAEFFRAPTVERLVTVGDDGDLATGFLVETWAARDNELHYSLVGSDGEVLQVESRTNSDRYNVFLEDPLKGPQTLVQGPGAGNAESPAGWLGSGPQNSIGISGNNTQAYLDADANNAPDSGGASVTNGDFLTQADLSVQPNTTGNRAVAVQNLFYLNNVLHDILYRQGFDEAAGNFQADNFGLGGAGNDPVLAEAQDGSGMNNANFSTPADGSPGRMQMYLWSGSGPTALISVGNVNYGAYTSAFGPAPTATGTNGALALYNDGSGTTTDACEAAVGSLTGKLVIVDRGTCDFTVKVENAQKAGAVGVLIANNTAEAAFAPGGNNRRIRIPSAMISLQDGQTLRTQLGQASNLRKNPTEPIMVDGDLDADIVFHEYGHGLTWRMIGSMSGKLSGAIGEGASDTLAYLINGDDRVAEYSYSSSGGIRRYPYSTHPLTYSDVTGSSVHNDGEIYAAAVWAVLENYVAVGLSANDVLFNFVDGMHYTPASPAYEDMRDGMLASADGTGRECLIWRGFAEKGIGVGADGNVSRTGKLTITESFEVPPECE